jgi:hypothetical protein
MLDTCKQRDELRLAEEGSQCPFSAAGIKDGRNFGNTSWHFITLLGELDATLLEQFFTDATPIYQKLADEKALREAQAASCG